MPESKDVLGMRNAAHAAAFGTCSRKKVGCAVYVDDKLVALGHNGAIAHESLCNHEGSTLPCDVAVHAEPRAIAKAARDGASTRRATVYVTCSPCIVCARLLVEAGVTRVVFGERFYRDFETVGAVFARAGIRFEQLEKHDD